MVDSKLGLVLCDRNTVPISLGDVTITLGASVELRGRCVPVSHNKANML